MADDLRTHLESLAEPIADRQVLVTGTLDVVLAGIPALEDVIGSSDVRRNRLGEAVLSAIEAVVQELRDEDARLAAEEEARDKRSAEELLTADDPA